MWAQACPGNPNKKKLSHNAATVHEAGSAAAVDRASNRDPRAEEGAVEKARGPLAEGPLQKRRREWGEKSQNESERRR